MTPLFLDAGIFIALVSKRDPNRDRALALLEAIQNGDYTRVVTSDYVLAEAWNYTSCKMRRKPAIEAIHRLASGTDRAPPLCSSVLRVHGTRFAAAVDRYRREFTRGLSFTDWTTVVLMEHERIHTIATFNTGFEGLVSNVVRG